MALEVSCSIIEALENFRRKIRKEVHICERTNPRNFYSALGFFWIPRLSGSPSLDFWGKVHGKSPLFYGHLYYTFHTWFLLVGVSCCLNTCLMLGFFMNVDSLAWLLTLLLTGSWQVRKCVFGFWKYNGAGSQIKLSPPLPPMLMWWHLGIWLKIVFKSYTQFLTSRQETARLKKAVSLAHSRFLQTSLKNFIFVFLV